MHLSLLELHYQQTEEKIMRESSRKICKGGNVTMYPGVSPIHTIVFTRDEMLYLNKRTRMFSLYVHLRVVDGGLIDVRSFSGEEIGDQIWRTGKK